MKYLALIGVLAVLTIVVMGVVIRINRRPIEKSITPLVLPKTPLTPREQAMFLRLQDAFPNHFVLAQVPFSAILRTRDRVIRNTFNGNVADFVLCSTGFQVLCVLELDDASHKAREAASPERDTLLKDAGIRVLRFKSIPESEELTSALARI